MHRYLRTKRLLVGLSAAPADLPGCVVPESGFSDMQSYHAALLSVCKAVNTFPTSRPPEDHVRTREGLDRTFRLVNAQRRKLRLGGPQVKEHNCLDAFMEHAHYLLSIQQGSTHHQETAWVTEVVVGQYLRDMGRAWAVLAEFAELTRSQLMQKVQSSGEHNDTPTNSGCVLLLTGSPTMEHLLFVVAHMGDDPRRCAPSLDLNGLLKTPHVPC